jgi:hypothetical protein
MLERYRIAASFAETPGIAVLALGQKPMTELSATAHALKNR